MAALPDTGGTIGEENKEGRRRRRYKKPHDKKYNVRICYAGWP